MFSVKIVSQIQSVFTVTKIAALLIIIIAGFFNYFTQSTETPREVLQNWFIGSQFNSNGLAMAFYSGLFSYSGW